MVRNEHEEISGTEQLDDDLSDYGNQRIDEYYRIVYRVAEENVNKHV
ncbi:MAG: type II toxin-antitoxin system YoeB family toxin [Treponema sp.]|nr:type II toxin-antitoxin system YoeB family toxin [Treponema sp.]